MSEIHFRVNPGEKEFSIEKGSIPEVSLTREPENGKANAELKNRLKEITGEEPGIVSGTSSRRKKLVFNQEEEEIRSKIRDFLDGERKEVQT